MVPAAHLRPEDVAQFGANLFIVLALVICLGLLVLFIALRPSKPIEWGWVILFSGFAFVVATRAWLIVDERVTYDAHEQAFIWIVVDTCLIGFAGSLVYTMRKLFSPRYWRQRRNHLRERVMGPSEEDVQ